MKIVREYNFNDLYENSWSGAIDTLDTIIKNDMEKICNAVSLSVSGNFDKAMNLYN